MFAESKKVYSDVEMLLEAKYVCRKSKKYIVI